MKKIYLGDSVYAIYDGYHIVLTTENGFKASNTIFLDDTVARNLVLYIEYLKAQKDLPEVTELDE